MVFRGPATVWWMVYEVSAGGGGRGSCTACLSSAGAVEGGFCCCGSEGRANQPRPPQVFVIGCMLAGMVVLMFYFGFKLPESTPSERR